MLTRQMALAAALLALAAMLAGCGGPAPHATPFAPASAAAASPSVGPASLLPTNASPVAPSTSSAPVGRPGHPCGGTRTPGISHVVWIWMENRTYAAVLGSGTDAPRLKAYASACGLATNYRGVTHPSLPNYLAATSGSTGGVTSDCGPAECPQSRPSLFGQIAAAGLQWRTYAEAMPAACALGSQGRYATKHNPAVYFVPVRSDCRRWDLPYAGFAGALRTGLPAFTFVAPDLCDDGHDCTTHLADKWLGATLDQVTGSPTYRAGDTAIFVTWDEGSDADQHIATVVIAPGIRPGTRVDSVFDHYSLLRATEGLLGLPPLGAARSAADLGAAFGLRRS